MLHLLFVADYIMDKKVELIVHGIKIVALLKRRRYNDSCFLIITLHLLFATIILIVLFHSCNILTFGFLLLLYRFSTY